MLFKNKLKNGIIFNRLYRFFLSDNPKGDYRKQFGTKSEREAVKFLKNDGYKILETNYRSKYGEVDIIAMDNKSIVFVEVKARKSGKFGTPLEAVNLKKQRKISMVALDYLKKNKKISESARFDVVGIEITKDNSEIKLIKNAFELSYR